MIIDAEQTAGSFQKKVCAQQSGIGTDAIGDMSQSPVVFRGSLCLFGRNGQENLQDTSPLCQKASSDILTLNNKYYADKELPMPFSLVPDRVMNCYTEITPEYLNEKGITLLLSDLDFTLAAKSTPRPDQTLRDWINQLHRAGIDFMIVSNNRSGRRVSEFCADLGVPYQGHAGKPSTRGLETAMQRAGTDHIHTAMLGDKLLTDMLAANRAEVLALMVEPVGGAVTAWQKVLHALQAPFKAICRRRMRKNG